MSAELILWRHGETEYNAARRIQGRVDIPLSEVGYAQAEAASVALAELGISRIVSSPLQRARQTAEVLAERLGLEVEIREDLIERSFGVWEGRTREEMAEGWPEAFARWRDGGEPGVEGAETRAAVGERVGAVLRSLAEEAESEELAGPVLVVSHGAAIAAGVTELLGVDAGTWFGLRGLDNCAWARLRAWRRAPGWVLEEWNIHA